MPSRSRTFVQVSGSPGEERFCVLREAAATTAETFVFSCVGGTCKPHGVPLTVASDLLVAAGISESDASRLLEEAQASHRNASFKPRD